MTLDLVDEWTLVERDLELISGKTAATRLGFALLLKFFGLRACFPVDTAGVGPEVATYLANQLKIPVSTLDSYDLSGRSAERHRSEIRVVFGFREFTRNDEARLAAWQAGEN